MYFLINIYTILSSYSMGYLYILASYSCTPYLQWTTNLSPALLLSYLSISISSYYAAPSDAVPSSVDCDCVPFHKRALFTTSSFSISSEFQLVLKCVPMNTLASSNWIRRLCKICSYSLPSSIPIHCNAIVSLLSELFRAIFIAVLGLELQLP
jgi:hypothetical protein